MEQKNHLIKQMLRGLRPIGLGPAAVTVYAADLGTEPKVAVATDGQLPPQVITAVHKSICRALKADAQLVPLEQLPGDRLALAAGAYRICLVPIRRGPEPRITTVAKAMEMQHQASASAHAASRIYKAGQTPTISFRVLKYEESKYERIVTGAVLEPEVVDASKTDESDGDIYSEEEIRQGMYWWMENAPSSYEFHHVEHGGQRLGQEDVHLLENWQARQPEKIGNQTIRKGGWIQTNRICETPAGEMLWKSVLSGELNSWSVGMQAMGQFEEDDGSAPDAGTPPA